MAKKIAISATSAQTRVRRLEERYLEANNRIREFEEENAEVMDRLRELATLRETALQDLETAVRETRINAGGMEVRVSPRRTFDGAYLWTRLEAQPDVRDRLLKVDYKVDANLFDMLVRSGNLDGEDVDKSVKDIKEIVSVYKRPPSFQLG
jgi:hypothetical protein